MLSLTKRTAISDMHDRGHSRVKIGRELGLSLRTVNAVIRAQESKASPVAVLRDKKAKARAKKLVEIDQWLVSK